MHYLRSPLFLIIAAILIISGSGFTRLDSYTGFCVEWHVVQKGESLDTLSRDFGVSRSELVAINKLSNPRRIYPGQRICLSTRSSADTTVYHTKKRVPPSVRCGTRSKNDTPYYHGYDYTFYHPSKHPCKPKHYYNREWGCGDWIDSGKCCQVNKNKDYGYTPSDCDCNIRCGNFEYRCDCQGFDKEIYHHGWDCKHAEGEEGYPKVYFEYRGNPAISVEDVMRDEKVTMRVFNYPYGQKFSVYMAPIAGKSHIVYRAGTFHTSKGRSMAVTAEIPEALHGCKKITIWTKGEDGGYVNYDWFYNNSTY